MLKYRAPTLTKTTDRLRRLSELSFLSVLRDVGETGVYLLSSSTPVDTGVTAASWRYRIESKGRRHTISWENTVMAGSVPLVLLVEYGHSTGTGGHISGRNFMSPALSEVYATLKALIAKELRQ